MSMPVDPQSPCAAGVRPLQWRIGLVGYGEVGRILAEDLRARGVARLLTYDIKLGGRDERALRAHAEQHGVELVEP